MFLDTWQILNTPWSKIVTLEFHVVFMRWIGNSATQLTIDNVYKIVRR